MRNSAVGRPMEILLVEDSLVDARFTIGALERGQIAHRLTLIRDGLEALEFLQQKGKFARAPVPDVVLLDLRLPKLDGLDLLQRMRQEPPLDAMPVVIMTSSNDEADLSKAQLLSVDCYITKPVNFEKFLSVVKCLKHAWHPDVILPAFV